MGIPLEPLDKERVDVKQLFKQMRGLAKAAARHQGKEGMSLKDLVVYSVEQLWVTGGGFGVPTVTFPAHAL